MNIKQTFRRSNLLFTALSAISVLAIVLIAAPSDAREHRGHNKGVHNSGHHKNYNRTRSHRPKHVRAGRSHRIAHNRVRRSYRSHRTHRSHRSHRSSGYRYRHGYNNYFAGVLTGYASSYLFHPYHYRRPYYGRTVYVTEPRVTVIEQPAAVVKTSTTETGTSCLQEREYQTTVIVNGDEVDAYGTACLQPDGSWMRGPARLVPDYD